MQKPRPDEWLARPCLYISLIARPTNYGWLRHCIQVNVVLILQTIAHYKRRTNELLNLLGSVSVTSSQKGAKKMRKKRKPKRFWTRPGRTGIWWQNFLDNVVILEEWIENFRLSKETFIELCDELQICFLCFPCVLTPFS